MKKKIWRVFLLAFVTGLAIHFAEMLTASLLMMGHQEWTGSMSIALLVLTSSLAIISFVVMGMIGFRDMTKKEIAHSALLFIAYYIAILIVERVSIHFGFYSIITMWLFIPTNMFSFIFSILMQFFEFSWILLVPSIFAPLLFVPFGKKANGLDFVQTSGDEDYPVNDDMKSLGDENGIEVEIDSARD